MENLTVVREGKEEDVSSYWMDLRKREDTDNWKKKHSTVLCGEIDCRTGRQGRRCKQLLDGLK